MPKYEIVFERKQTFIERMEVEANSEAHAEDIANEMLANEKVAFDVESNTEEDILEICEILNNEGDE
jgi:hypothetical protein